MSRETAKRQPAKELNDVERNKLFELWYRLDRNYHKAAKEFGVARSTVYRMAEQYDWMERAEKIRGNVQHVVDKKIEKQEVSNVTLAKAMLTKEVKQHLNKENEVAGSVQSIMLLLRYIDEHEGSLLPVGGNTFIQMNLNQKQRAELAFVLTEDTMEPISLPGATRPDGPTNGGAN